MQELARLRAGMLAERFDRARGDERRGVARQALEEAGWEVKTAIAAVRLGISAAESRSALARAEGSLRTLLDPDA